MEDIASSVQYEHHEMQKMLKCLRGDIVAKCVRDFSRKIWQSRNELLRWANLHGDKTIQSVNDMLRRLREDDSGGVIEELMTLWIVAFDPMLDQIYLEDETGGILCPTFFYSEKWLKAVTSNMVIPFGVGSIGYALSIGEALCLPNTQLDPRGTVTVEDYLLGNTSFASVPVFSSDDEEANLLCYVAVAFPIANLWTDTGFERCSNQTKGSGCFTNYLSEIVTKYKTSIRLAMQIKKERCIVHAFTKLRNVSQCVTNVGSLNVEKRRYHLIKQMCFQEEVPSPLGIMQILLLPLNGNEKPIYACSEKTVQRLFIKQIHVDTRREMIYNNRDYGDIKKDKGCFGELLRTYGVCDEIEVKRIETEHADIKKAKSDSTDFRIRFSIGIKKDDSRLFDQYDQKELNDYVNSITTMLSSRNLHQKLENLRLLENYLAATITQKKLIRGVQKLIFSSVCRYLVDRKRPKPNNDSVLGVVSSRFREDTEYWNTLFPERLNVIKSQILFVIAHITEKQPNWQIDAELGLGSSEDYSDEEVYNVQQYLAAMSKNELESDWGWKRDSDILVKDEDSKDIMIRLTKPIGCKKLCSNANGGRAFETAISSPKVCPEDRLVAVRRKDNGDRRILEYYTMPSNPSASLADICCEDMEPCRTAIWKQHDTELWVAGISFSPMFYAKLESMQVSNIEINQQDKCLMGKVAEKSSNGKIIFPPFDSSYPAQKAPWGEYTNYLKGKYFELRTEQNIVVYPIIIDAENKFVCNLFMHQSVHSDDNVHRNVNDIKEYFSGSQRSLLEAIINCISEFESQIHYINKQVEHRKQIEQVSASLAHEITNGLIGPRAIVHASGDKAAIEAMEWVRLSVDAVDRAHRELAETNQGELPPMSFGSYFRDVVYSIKKKYSSFAGAVGDNYAGKRQLFELSIDPSIENELIPNSLPRDTWKSVLREVLYNAIKYCDFVYGDMSEVAHNPYGIRIDILDGGGKRNKKVIIRVRNGLWPGMGSDKEKAKETRSDDLVSMGRYRTKDDAKAHLSSGLGSKLIKKLLESQYKGKKVLKPVGDLIKGDLKWEWLYEFIA